jgi:hypothetical protein
VLTSSPGRFYSTYYTTSQNWAEYNGDLVPVGSFTWPTLPSLETSVSNRAETSFLKQLYNKQTTFAGGVFLGELKEAIHMIRSPAQALRSGFKNYLNDVSRLRRGRGKMSYSRLQQAVAGTYLEHAFGWAPLVNDIDDAMKAASNALNYRCPVDRVYARAKDNYNVLENTSFIDNLGYQIGTYRWVTNVAYEVSYVGGFYVRSDASGVSTDFGVNLRNFVPTLWELVPWSFAIDYFSNIGSCLEALCADTSQLFYCAKGIKRTSTRTLVWVETHNNFVITRPDKPHVFIREVSSLAVQKKTVQRQAVTISTMGPSLRFSFPGLFSRQSLNLSALVAQSKAASRNLTS